ncbi:unnamed protein product, partial [Allacma fusca]
IVRNIAWYWKFLRWLKTKDVSSRSLTVVNIKEAEKLLLRAVQTEVFQNLPENYAKGLTVLKDTEGSLRC